MKRARSPARMPAGKKGYFEIANNGVMFLDEIGELPLEMQAKLLRVIQDGEFYKVGGTSPIKTNVRIISATNRDLEKFVEEGKFRRDLYYRLNVVPIRIPNLSDRVDDIPALVNHFLKKYGKKFGIARGIADSAMEYLQQLLLAGQYPGARKLSAAPDHFGQRGRYLADGRHARDARRSV